MHSSNLAAKPSPNAFKKPVPRIARPVDMLKIPAEFLPDMVNRGKRMQLWRGEVANAVVPVWFKHHDKAPNERAYLYVKDRIQWAAWGEPIDDEEEMQKFLRSQEERDQSRSQIVPVLNTETKVSLANEESELACAPSNNDPVAHTDGINQDDENNSAVDEIESIWAPPSANTITWTTVMGLPCVSLGDLCQARLKNNQSNDILYYSNLKIRDRGLAFRLMDSEFSMIKKIEVERTPLPRGDYWREWRWQQIEHQQQAFETWFRVFYRTNKPAIFKTSESCFTPGTLGKKRKRDTMTADQLGRTKGFLMVQDEKSPVRLLEPELSKLSPTWPRGVLRQERSRQVRKWCERFSKERTCPNCETSKPKLVQRLSDEKLEYCCSQCSMTLGWSVVVESDDDETSASGINLRDAYSDEDPVSQKSQELDEMDSAQSGRHSVDLDDEEVDACNMLATPDGTPEPAVDNVGQSKMSWSAKSQPAECCNETLVESEIASLRGQMKELVYTIQELKSANKRLMEDYMEYIEGEANLLHQISRPFASKLTPPYSPSADSAVALGRDECAQKSSWWSSWFFGPKI